MAGSTRIKLNFSQLPGQADSWFLVNSKTYTDVSDVTAEIVRRFSLQTDGIRLLLDGFDVPAWESVDILRENDELRVIPSQLKRRADDEDVSAIHKKQRFSKFSKATVPTHTSNSNQNYLRLRSVELEAQNKNVDNLRRLPDKTVTVNPNTPVSVIDLTYLSKKYPEVMTPPSSSKDKVQRVEASGLLQSPTERMDVSPPEKETTTEIIVLAPEDCLNIPITPDTAEGENARERRKRSRKRVRKNRIKTDETELGDGTKHSPAPKNKHPRVKNTGIHAILEHYKTSSGATHVKFGSDSDDDNSPEQAMPTATTEAPPPQVSEVYCDEGPMSDVHVVPREQEDPPQTDQMMFSSPSSDSAKLAVKTFVKGPFTNVQVFNRKKNKKAGFVPLSKSEQLNSMGSNISSFHTNSPGQRAQSPGTPDKSSDQGPPETLLRKDYSGLQPVKNPQPGQLIAFKMLEMNEEYSPEISQYKEAEIIDVNSSLNKVQLKLLHPKQTKKDGRFEVRLEEEDSILTNTMEEEMMLNLTWTSLLDPLLLESCDTEKTNTT